MRTLFLFIFVFTIWATSAQEPEILTAKYQQDIFQRFDNYTTKDGLPSNSLYRVFQDCDGFIWIATDNGLSRFDGYTFVNFQTIEGDSTSISNETITAIVQDNDGYIWVGTMNGLNRLNPITGEFKRYFKENSTFLNDNWIRALYFDSDEFLWIDDSKGTLVQLHTKSYKHWKYTRESSTISNFSNHVIYETKDKTILAGGYGIQLIVVDKLNHTSTMLTDTVINNSSAINPCSDFWEDEDGYLWIANLATSMGIKDLKSGKFYCIKKLPSTYAICPDKNGAVWLGGYSGGALMYNKNTNIITYYRNSPNNQHSILGEHTLDIMCDRSGTVWFATDGGLSCIRPYKYKFPLFKHIPEIDSPSSNQITSVFQDYNGDIWLGTMDAGLFSHNLESNSFKYYRFDKDNQQTISSRYVTAIAQDKDGMLWLTLWNGYKSALNSLNKNTSIFKRYSTIDNYYWNGDVAVSQANVVTVGSWGYGICYFDRQLGDYSSMVSANTYGFPTESKVIQNLPIDKTNRMWFSNGSFISSYGILNQKFALYTPLRNEYKHVELLLKRIPHKKVDIPSHSNNWYNFTDINGNYWLIKPSSLTEYLYTTDSFQSYIFKATFIPSSIANSISGNRFWIGGTNSFYSFNLNSKQLAEIKVNSELGEIYAITETSDNNFLIGSSTGLYEATLNSINNTLEVKKVFEVPFRVISKLNNNTFLLGGDRGLYKLTNKPKSLKPVKGCENRIVYTIFKASDNCIYIGANDGMLLYTEINGIEKEWKSNPKEKGQLAGSKVMAISQASNGAIWVQTDRCISMLGKDSKTFTNYLEPSHYQTRGSLAIRLLYDSKGNLWVGETTNFGLNRIDAKTGYVEHYFNIPWDSTSLPLGEVNDIFESHNGTIWVATDNSLARFVPETNNFIRYEMRNGFTSNAFMAIQEDSKGNLWISTINGLSRFNPSTHQCDNYSWKDGLQEGDFRWGCATSLSNGQLLFGGLGGYNIFYPDSIKRNPYSPKPIISSIRIDGSIRFYSNPQHISLKYSERNIEISFSSNDFNYPENNQIDYKLEGFDNEFTNAGNNRIAKYTNLSPGNYQFILKASNNDSLWCKEPLIINISVGYPIWFRWWAIVLEISLLVGLIVLIVRLRTRMIVKQKDQLEKEVASRTEQVIAKNEEITLQRDVLSKQKDHIHKIHNQLSDSIEYAQYLQSSIYLSKDMRDEILGENFLLYLPKDKVGGDFFWAHQVNNKIVFAVVDCTGHGVPGALMGMIGFTSIKEVSQSEKVMNPSEALSILHHKVSIALSPGSGEASMVTAMDVGYCVLDRVNRKLKFAGGHIDIFIAKWIDNKKSIVEIKGDNKRVGNPLQGDLFSETEIDISVGDIIYLFSDGLSDQFNSDKNEKFSKRRVKESIEFISDFPFEVQSSLILSRYYEWKGINEQTDDITVLGVKV